MKKKPKGRKYRNLYARGDVVYYERWIGDERIRRSCDTSDWDEAVAVRDLLESRKGLDNPRLRALKPPTFSESSTRYLAEDTNRLAPTTRGDRPGYFREDGPLAFFKDLPLDEIDAPMLHRWWTAEIESRDLSISTGRHYLSAMSAVFGYAIARGLLDASPVAAFRAQLRHRSRTKQGRAENEGGRHVRPIESREALQRLVDAAYDEAERCWEQETKATRGGGSMPRSHHERTEGVRSLVAVLLMLDAGLRIGEVAGLTWQQINWGEGPDRCGREIVIDRARPRGREESTPKSGRSRRVEMSLRLCHALQQLFAAQHAARQDARVLPGFDPANFSKRAWARIVSDAKLEALNPKDLRDTYASWLVSLNVPLAYVSAQLGHADVGVTGRHYTRWVGSGYREPVRLQPGDVYADLIARVVADSPQSPPTKGETAGGAPPSARPCEGNGVSDGDRTRDLQSHNLAL